MPQLDKFTFATQIFWFCIFFLVFYFMILNKFLVKLLKVLRLREFLLGFFNTSINYYYKEEHLALLSGNVLLRSKVVSAKRFLGGYINAFNLWYFARGTGLFK